jgi:hypothetical protein
MCMLEHQVHLQEVHRSRLPGYQAYVFADRTCTERTGNSSKTGLHLSPDHCIARCLKYRIVRGPCSLITEKSDMLIRHALAESLIL